MCGIFGISGHPDAANITHLGLYSLQHRGQESTGIVAVAVEGDELVEELCRMLGAGPGDEGARRHAQELLARRPA